VNFSCVWIIPLTVYLVEKDLELCKNPTVHPYFIINIEKHILHGKLKLKSLGVILAICSKFFHRSDLVRISGYYSKAPGSKKVDISITQKKLAHFPTVML